MKEPVLDELEGVALAAVLQRKVLLKNRLQAVVFPLLRRNVVLDEVVEGLDLHVQEVRVVPNGRDVGKRVAVVTRREVNVFVAHVLVGVTVGERAVGERSVRGNGAVGGRHRRRICQRGARVEEVRRGAELKGRTRGCAIPLFCFTSRLQKSVRERRGEEPLRRPLARRMGATIKAEQFIARAQQKSAT